MKWIKNDINQDQVREISARFSVDLLTAAILVRRGVTDFEELLYYLESDIRYLHNPFLFTEMEDAVDRTLQAIEEGERVLIFGDRDADGITSTVLLFEALEGLGVDVEWQVPLGDDLYGLSKDAVRGFAERSGTLIITVDCGISSIEEIDYAGELGVDVLVLDHHNPQSETPNAWAIIDPKLEDSGYEFEGLAGCAVAAKFIWALKFARTPMYNHPVCLLNIEPGNDDSYIVTAVKLVNLVEVERIHETLVPGVVRIDQTRLYRFLADQEIYVYDSELQTRLFHKIFGMNVEVSFLDAEPEITKLFPTLKGKSLLRIRELSTTARYLKTAQSELDIFVSLFITYLLKKEKSLSEEYEAILDLVALGTVADLMPLGDENRILVRLGLDTINAKPRKGLHELLQKQGLLLKKIGTHEIAWQITPLINSTGRMGVPDKAVRLFLSDDPSERNRLADEVMDLNRERKAVGEAAWNSIYQRAQASYEECSGKLVLVSGDDIQRGITGTLALKLLNYFNTTAVAVAFTDETAIGSVRGTGDVNVKNILEKRSDLFIDFGGHDFAAGFSIKLDRFDEFKRFIMKEVEDHACEIELVESVSIDAELPGKYMNPDLMKIVELFEPYGEGNEKLKFLYRNAKILDLNLIGRNDKSHVRLLFDAGKHKWPAVYWNAAERVGKDFDSGDIVEVVFTLGKNFFQNTEQFQLTVIDIKRV